MHVKILGSISEAIVHMTAQVDAGTKPTMYADVLNCNFRKHYVLLSIIISCG